MSTPGRLGTRRVGGPRHHAVEVGPKPGQIDTRSCAEHGDCGIGEREAAQRHGRRLSRWGTGPGDHDGVVLARSRPDLTAVGTKPPLGDISCRGLSVPLRAAKQLLVC